WTLPPITVNVRLARLFVSFSSAIGFAGSTRTSSVWTPLRPFVGHDAVTVALAPAARVPIDWSGPTATPSTRNRTATSAVPPAATFAITALRLAASPLFSLVAETVSDDTVRSGNGASGCDTGTGPSGRPRPGPSANVTHGSDGCSPTAG